MKSKRFIKNNKKEHLMDMTPLIDVVFLLLIFFMVATTFNNYSSMKLDLPEVSKNTKPIKELNLIQIIVDKNKKISIVVKNNENEKIITVKENTLKNTLIKEITNQNNNKNITLIADKKIDYGYVVKIIEIIKESGANGLNIETIIAN